MYIKLKTLFNIIVILVTFASASIAQDNPFDGPIPLAVVIERNPWLWVYGADTPSMILYADGTFIYLDKKGVPPQSHRQVKLGKSQLNSIKNALGPTPETIDLHSNYLFDSAFDLPSIDIYLSNSKATKIISVYGVFDKNGKLTKTNIQKEKNKIIPSEIVRIYELLNAIKTKNALAWNPKFIELMLWPYEYSPLEPVTWPSTWPDLTHKFTQKRDKDKYSIFFPFSKMEEMVSFFSKIERKQAVLLDKRKWAFDVRFVFPSEPIWQKAIQAIESN